MSPRPLAALGQPARAGASTFSLRGPLDSPPSPQPAGRLRGPVAVPFTSRLPDRGRGRGLSTPENQVGRWGALAAWWPLPGFGSPQCIQSAVGGQLDDRHDGASACSRSPSGCLRGIPAWGRYAATRAEAEGLDPCKARRSKHIKHLLTLHSNRNPEVACVSSFFCLPSFKLCRISALR